MLGGGQERGRRSGTENVPYIIALGTAAALMQQHLQDGTAERVREMRDSFQAALLTGWHTAVLNGHPTQRLPTTASICFPELSAAEMLILLDERGICCSAGSACHSASVHPSHVLEAMGYSAAHAASTLRFSFSRFNTQTEVHEAAQTTLAVAQKLQALQGADPSSLITQHVR
jgi:cysteine desulfurase